MQHLDAPAQPSLDSTQRLRDYLLTEAELQTAGYVLEQYSPAELNRKKRCERCTRAVQNRHSRHLHGRGTRTIVTTANPAALPSRMKSSLEAEKALDNLFENLSVTLSPNNSQKPVESIIRCKFHPGRLINKKWTCCGNHAAAKPCVGEEQHSPHQYATGELEEFWTFYSTPPAESSSNRPVAVVIDCEMGIAVSGESELIRVFVIDFYSRCILLDSLVFPSIEMAHYNPRYSGVSHKMMQDALRHRRCLRGRDQARAAVWRIVGPQTIVIGHATNQDLISLRWTHKLVIDTLVIEQKRGQKQRKIEEAAKAAEVATKTDSDQTQENTSASKHNSGLSLKALTLEKLNRTIQVNGKGHDSVEDALATRDLLQWYMSHTPRSDGKLALTH